MVYVNHYTALRKIWKLKDRSFGNWDKLEEMFLPKKPQWERKREVQDGGELGEVAY